MWDWYTGLMIWKTQNPWTALRGQMYDYYLDPNAGLYGLHNAAEPLHVMCNPVDGMVYIVNNTFETRRDLMLQLETIDFQGISKPITQVLVEVGPSLTQKYLSVKEYTDKLGQKQGFFLLARLLDLKKNVLSDNLYWLPDSLGNYSGLATMPKCKLAAIAREMENGKIELTLSNASSSPLAFFNRVSLVDANTKKRVLPTFYNNNYISVLPGETKSITIEYPELGKDTKLEVSLKGWNVDEQFITIE
jgi:hypothetical protein